MLPNFLFHESLLARELKEVSAKIALLRKDGGSYQAFSALAGTSQ